MDPNIAQQSTPPALLSAEQKNSLFNDLELAGISEDKKQELMDQMIDTVLNRIFSRVSEVLTEEDLKTLDDLNLRPDGEQAVGSFLVSRVPNLDAIAKEEVDKFRAEVKKTLTTIKANLP